MILTKREKILLQFLVALLLFAFVLSVIFTPAANAYLASDAECLSLLEEKKRVEGILNYPGLTERLNEEKKKAKENYEYFYSVLNSYTIDGIVNQLLQQENLKIITLNITPYEDAYYDFAPPSEDLETGSEAGPGQEHVLVKSVITLNVRGEYGNILEFVDRLNQTSTCLRADSVSIARQDMGIVEEEGITASMRIYIYGIDVEPTLEEYTNP